MGIEEFPQPAVSTDRAMKKLALNTKIASLIEQGADLNRLAELLGAEEFIEHHSTRGKRGAVRRLDVVSFIDWTLQSAEGRSYGLRLPEHMLVLDGVILPPDEGEGVKKGSGVGMEAKEYIPRTRYLIDLLSEMKIEYAVIDGTNTDEMMRQLSYKAFLLPTLGKMVLVCDEEGNATYIVNNVRGEGGWRRFIGMQKSELRTLQDNGEVEVVIYSGDSEIWKQGIVARLIQESIITGTKRRNESPTGEEIFKGTPPEGWISRKELLMELGRDYEWVTVRVSKATEAGQEVVRKYKYDQSKAAENFYSPTFVAALREENAKIETAPSGWLTLRGIAVELGKDRGWVDRRVNKHRATHPDWFRHYQNPISHQYQEYFSPSLIEILRSESKAAEVAPLGWKTIRAMAVELETHSSVIERILQLLSFSAKKYSGKFLDSGGKLTMHYHPDVFKAIKEKIQEGEMPEGYISLKTLTHEANVTEKTALKAIERLRVGDDDFRVVQKSEESRSYQVKRHLADRVVAEFMNRIPAPINWKSKRELARDLGRDVEWVDARVRRYLKKYPNWASEHPAGRGKLGRMTTFYSPELQEKLKEENGSL